MRITNIFMKFLKAFPHYVYGMFVTIMELLYPLETHINENNCHDVTEFVRSFERKYGKARPPFCTCDYVTVVNRAKATLSYLLVYLHGDDHEDSDFFCRNALCSRQFLEFVAESPNLLVWACNINSSEGFCVSKIIREHSYPFIGLVAISTNSRMYLVARSEGVVSAGQLVEFVSANIANNALGVAVCRAEREERSNNRVVRRDREAEIADCVQLKEKEMIEQTRLERQRRSRQTSVSALLQQHQQSESPEPEIAIRVKLPCGIVLQRSFCATDSIKLLFYFIFCSFDSPRDFSVFANCPRREIVCRPTHFEWDSSVLSRLPRDTYDDPPDFRIAQISTNTTLYVVDNDA